MTTPNTSPEKGAQPFNFDQLKNRWYRQAGERKKLTQQRLATLHQLGPQIFKKYGIKKVILFGSVLTGKCTTNSDIDMLLIPLADKDFWQIRHELEEAIGCRIDIYTQTDEPQFIEKIMARGKVIYAA